MDIARQMQMQMGCANAVGAHYDPYSGEMHCVDGDGTLYQVARGGVVTDIGTTTNKQLKTSRIPAMARDLEFWTPSDTWQA